MPEIVLTFMRKWVKRNHHRWRKTQNVTWYGDRCLPRVWVKWAPSWRLERFSTKLLVESADWLVEFAKGCSGVDMTSFQFLSSQLECNEINIQERTSDCVVKGLIFRTFWCSPPWLRYGPRSLLFGFFIWKQIFLVLGGTSFIRINSSD